MEVVLDRDGEVANWAATKLNQPITPPYRAIGFAADGELVGATIFNDFNGSNIEITIYGPGCMTREAIRFCFDYAFRQQGVKRITARTRRDNVEMRKLFPRLGFIYEGTAKRYFGPDKGDDALLFALFPDAAEKWMKA